MNLICPCCGQAGNETVFRQIGQKKLLCTNCKAVLQFALKCPACDGIISVPFISPPPVNRFISFLGFRSQKNRHGSNLTCPVCDFRERREVFDKVVVFKEAYSIIM